MCQLYREFINWHDNLGHQPLHQAVFRNDERLVDILLSAGAEIDGRKKGDWTALMIAASKGYFQITKILMQNGQTPIWSILMVPLLYNWLAHVKAIKLS